MLKNKFIFFFLFFNFLFMFAFTVVYASVFIYYPAIVNLSGVSPPLVYLEPENSNVIVELSSHKANANVTIMTVSGTVQLLSNPDFYSNQNYWYCSPGNYLSCYWLSSDAGASGGVIQIYGRLPQLGWDRAFVFQEVSVPNVPISSAVISARIRYVSGGALTTYYIGIADTNRVIIYYCYGIPSVSYAWYSCDITQYVQPGQKYLVFVGVGDLALRPITVDFRIDTIYFYISTNVYTFSGNVLDLNITDSNIYVARLDLISWSTQSDLNVEISVANVTGYETSKIIVENGVPTVMSTGTIELGKSPPGYSSGWIRAIITKGSAINSTLVFELIYCTSENSVCVTYPLKIVIDPFIQSVNINGKDMYNFTKIEEVDANQIKKIPVKFIPIYPYIQQ